MPVLFTKTNIKDTGFSANYWRADIITIERSPLKASATYSLYKSASDAQAGRASIGGIRSTVSVSALDGLTPSNTLSEIQDMLDEKIITSGQALSGGAIA